MTNIVYFVKILYYSCMIKLLSIIFCISIFAGPSDLPSEWKAILQEEVPKFDEPTKRLFKELKCENDGTYCTFIALNRLHKKENFPLLKYFGYDNFAKAVQCFNHLILHNGKFCLEDGAKAIVQIGNMYVRYHLSFYNYMSELDSSSTFVCAQILPSRFFMKEELLKLDKKPDIKTYLLSAEVYGFVVAQIKDHDLMNNVDFDLITSFDQIELKNGVKCEKSHLQREDGVIIYTGLYKGCIAFYDWKDAISKFIARYTEIENVIRKQCLCYVNLLKEFSAIFDELMDKFMGGDFDIYFREDKISSVLRLFYSRLTLNLAEEYSKELVILLKYPKLAMFLERCLVATKQKILEEIEQKIKYHELKEELTKEECDNKVALIAKEHSFLSTEEHHTARRLKLLKANLAVFDRIYMQSTPTKLVYFGAIALGLKTRSISEMKISENDQRIISAIQFLNAFL